MSFGKSGPYGKRFESGAKLVTYNLGKGRIHTYVAPEKSFGNATHIIESKNYLVLVDTQYSVPYSKEFRKYANSLGKPIAGVIISHGHPDHYFGLTSAFADVPSYALSEVIRDIEKNGPQMVKEGKKTMGDLVPNKVTIPNNILHPGKVTIDGIEYIYTKYNNAEADTQVIIEIPKLRVVIIQDAVYNGYHPWLGQHTKGWIDLLNVIKEKYKRDGIVLVGHGMPASPKIYSVMKQYLVDAEDIFSKYGTDKKAIEKALIEKYPKYKGRHIIPMFLGYMFSSQ